MKNTSSSGSSGKIPTNKTISKLQIGRNLNKLDNLKNECSTQKKIILGLQRIYAEEKATLDSKFIVRDELLASLNDIQELIDCDPLPEGAQPRDRILQRDQLAIQLSQLDTNIRLQKNKIDEINKDILNAEKMLFVADLKLNKFVEVMEQTQEALAAETEKDLIRFVKHLFCMYLISFIVIY